MDKAVFFIKKGAYIGTLFFIGNRKDLPIINV
jgi:hypothetical protein